MRNQIRYPIRFVLSLIGSALLGMLAGCQAPEMEMPLGDERGPEQVGLRIEFNPGFASRGVLASVPTHFGRAYADEGFLEFRIATVRNEGAEEVEFFPILAQESDLPMVVLHHRMWRLFPPHVREVIIGFGDGATTEKTDSAELLVDYAAKFAIVNAKVVFDSGLIAPFPEDWGKVLNPRGIRIRGGESAEVRWVLGLRAETPLLAGTSVRRETYGVERAGQSFLPEGTLSLPAPNFRVETLIAHSILVAVGQRFAARSPGGEKIHPLHLDARFRKPFVFVEDRIARQFDAELNLNLPLESVRYQIPGLPVLL